MIIESKHFTFTLKRIKFNILRALLSQTRFFPLIIHDCVILSRPIFRLLFLYILVSSAEWERETLWQKGKVVEYTWHWGKMVPPGIKRVGDDWRKIFSPLLPWKYNRIDNHWILLTRPEYWAVSLMQKAKIIIKIVIYALL